MAGERVREEEVNYNLAAAEPELLAGELERVIPLDPSEIVQADIPSGLRVKLARLSVIETVVLALIIALMCLGVVAAVMHYFVAPAQLAQSSNSPQGAVTHYNMQGISPTPQETPAASPLAEMLRWQYKLKASTISAPACEEDGSLMLTLDKRKLLALAPDGSERYTFEPQGGWQAKMTAPAAAESMAVIVGLNNGKVIKVNGWGEVDWQCDLKDAILAPPVVDNHSLVYCVAENGQLSCLYPQGGVTWSCKVKGECTHSSPVLVQSGLLYQVTDAGDVALIFKQAVQWQKSFDLNAAVQAVAGSKGCLFAVDSSGRLVCISVTGELLWSITLGGHARGAICWGNKSIYAGNNYGELYAITPEGKMLWKTQLGAQLSGIRIDHDSGRIYVYAQNGKFYVLDPTGQLLYSYDGGCMAQGIALGPANIVYFISYELVSTLQD